MNTWLRREMRTLAQAIATQQPDAICSTYPVYAYLVAALRAPGQAVPPHFNVVTDSISINSLWWRADCAGWFVPNEDSAVRLREAGVDPDRVHVAGFPVAQFFAEYDGRLSPPELGSGTAPRVLYIINSGTRGAADTARRLLADSNYEITCTVGRNEALRANLLAAAKGRSRPAAILGWTNEIPRLLMTHHVVISKAGGATTQEAIAARCPMLVNQIVPGQEEGNYELLRRRGIGALTQTSDEVIAVLRHAFADDGRVWRGWRAALEPLARPTAAADIVAAIASSPAVAGARAMNRGSSSATAVVARRESA